MKKFLIILILVSPFALASCLGGGDTIAIQGKELPDDLK